MGPGEREVKTIYQHLRWLYWSVRRAHCVLWHLHNIEIVQNFCTGQTVRRGDFLTCLRCVHILKQLQPFS
jgi:hypothetical protein